MPASDLAYRRRMEWASVIKIVFHSVETKHRSLESPSENACARKVASVIA
jgi:hypothetical protein